MGTLLSGVAILAICIAYELKPSLKEPYLPLRLLKDIKYTSCVIWCAIEAMNFYAFGYVTPPLSLMERHPNVLQHYLAQGRRHPLP